MRSLAFSPDSRLLAIAEDDWTVNIWRAATGVRVSSFPVNGSWGLVVLFAPDNRTVITGGAQNSLDLRDAYTGRIVRSIKAVGQQDTIAFSSDGVTLACSGEEGSIDLYNWRTGAKLKALKPHVGSWISHIAFAGDGRTLACAGMMSASVEVWNVKTGRLIRSFSPPSGESLGPSSGPASLSPDGRLLAMSAVMGMSHGCPIYLWDVASGHLLRTVNGQSTLNQSLSFSADGTKLNVGGIRSGITVYNVKTGAPVGAVHRDPSAWFSAISPNGLLEADADNDGAFWMTDLVKGVRLWSHNVRTGGKDAAPPTSQGRQLAQTPQRPVTRPQAVTPKPAAGDANPATQALIRAISTGGLGSDAEAKKLADEIKKQLAAGADPNAHPRWGTNAMMVFAWVGDLPAVQDLVKRGVDVNTHDVYGGTALLDAAENGHEDVVQYLIEHGADLKDEKGDSLLKLKGDKAAMTAAMMRMLATAAHSNPFRGGGTPRLDTEPTAALLVAWGADVNARDDDGGTPLMYARQPFLIRTLLDHGADPNAQDKGMSVFSILFPYIGDGTEVLDLLLKHGLAVNADDGRGTPLMQAAFQGRMVLARRLLEVGADPNAAQKTPSFTALIYASGQGHMEMVRLLLDHGAKVNARDTWRGGTALMSAAQRGDAEIVRLLLAHGADVNVRDKEGKSLLQVATEADANAHDKFGVLALLKKAGAKE